MPKAIRVRKKSEYIRFRPYHVFSAPAKHPPKQALFGRVLAVVVIIALIAVVGMIALHRH